MPAFTTMARGVGPAGIGRSTTLSFMQPAMPGLPWTNVRPGGLWGASSSPSPRDIASSWNWRDGRWDYYELPRDAVPEYGERVTHAVPSGGGLAEVPEQSGHPLPMGSRLVGSGDVAIGTVVQSPETGTNRGWWIAAGALAVLCWMTWGRKATPGRKATSRLPAPRRSRQSEATRNRRGSPAGVRKVAAAWRKHGKPFDKRAFYDSICPIWRSGQITAADVSEGTGWSVPVHTVIRRMRDCEGYWG